MLATPRRRLAIALAALLTLPATYSGISIYSAHVLTRPKNQIWGGRPVRFGPEGVAWSARTVDGLTLRGWHLRHESPRDLIVLVHGMGYSLDSLANLGRDLHDLGHDVLLFDLRGHGRSDPARLSMGRREREDIRAVIAWAEDHGYDSGRVGWLGQSLGASTLLMEAAENPKVRVLVADSPFGDLPGLLGEQLPKHSHLPRFFNPGILLAAHRVFGTRTDDLIPLDSARGWGDRALMVIHGEADSTVPVAQARRLAKAAGPRCRFVEMPDVEHCEAYLDDPEGYVERVEAFFARHLTSEVVGRVDRDLSR